MDVATLAIAVLGLVLAVVSLVWQVVTWTYEGAKVRVTASFGFLTYGPELSDRMVIVEASNVGRSQVELLGWGFDVGGNASLFVPRAVRGSTDLPHTLTAGHTAKFFLPLAALKEGLRQENITRAPRAFVTLGTGGKAYAKPLKLA
jgi:hypothetical protein